MKGSHDDAAAAVRSGARHVKAPWSKKVRSACSHHPEANLILGRLVPDASRQVRGNPTSSSTTTPKADRGRPHHQLLAFRA